MTSLENQTMLKSQTESLQGVWAEIRAELAQQKAQVYEQIGHYPTPITGCDQQFNYLLDKQSRILKALARLSEVEQASRVAADPAQVIDNFVQIWRA
jgi:hypothetical protein